MTNNQSKHQVKGDYTPLYKALTRVQTSNSRDSCFVRMSDADAKSLHASGVKKFTEGGLAMLLDPHHTIGSSILAGPIT